MICYTYNLKCSSLKTWRDIKYQEDGNDEDKGTDASENSKIS